MWAKKWKRLVPLALFVFVVGSVAMVEVTSTNKFCSNCHIMEPYYDSWARSAHKHVACVKCHISPGVDSFVAAKLNGLGQVVDDVLNRTSTKPSASVNELSCTRSGCHTVETLTAKATVNESFKFRHDKHLGTRHLGVEITCSTCHSHVKGDEHFEVNTSVCITCHMIETVPSDVDVDVTGTDQAMFSYIRLAVREPRMMIASDEAPPGASPELPGESTFSNGDPAPPTSCKVCHEPPDTIVEYEGLEVNHEEFLSFGASCESCHRNATATPNPIDDGRCLQCHNFGIERATDAKEMHQVHSLGRHKVECFNCHGAIMHGPVAQSMSLEQFDCRQCHINQHAVQRLEYLLAGTDGASSAQAVNPMFLAHVDCTGCHVKARALHTNPLSGAKVTAATPEACDRCHKAGFGAMMVPQWQEATKRLFAQAEEDLARTEPLAQSPDAVALVAEARELINMVKVDGSWGVHNPRYTQRLLDDARQKLAQAREISEPSP